MVEKRTKKQIENIIVIIQRELKGLPRSNVFGDSNREEKQLLREWLAELDAALKGETVVEQTDVWLWLTRNRNSALNDYEQTPTTKEVK